MGAKSGDIRTAITTIICGYDSFTLRRAGSTDVLLEKDIVNKILDIQKLKENDKQHVFALLDAFIKQTKFKSIM